MPTPVKLDALTDTWTDSGTTYNGIYLDVTDTASAAGSLLQRLDIGTSEKFGVDKNGYVRIGGSVVLQRSGTTTTLGTSSDTALVGYGAFALNNTGNASLTLKADTDANSSTATADILFNNNNGTTVGRIRWDESSSTLNLGYGAANHLTINSSGNVGIGTSSPGFLLDVSGIAAIDEIRLTGANFARIGVDPQGSMPFLGYNLYSPSSATYQHVATGACYGVGTNGGVRIFAASSQSAGTAATEVARFAENGLHIGGTTAPNKFTVTHDEAVNTWSSVSDASTDAVVKILGSNNATPYGLYLGYANSSNNAQGIQAGDGTNALPLTLNPKGGAIMMESLPTSDPTNAGELWNDSGTLKVSAG